MHVTFDIRRDVPAGGRTVERSEQTTKSDAEDDPINKGDMDEGSAAKGSIQSGKESNNAPMNLL